jgi:hypothetical protein
MVRAQGFDQCNLPISEGQSITLRLRANIGMLVPLECGSYGFVCFGIDQLVCYYFSIFSFFFFLLLWGGEDD